MTALAEMSDAQLRDRFNDGTFPPTKKTLGMVCRNVDRAKGTVELEFEGKPEFCNPMGVVQGGFLSAMLDEAMALAAIAKSPEPIFVPTLELKVSFLAPAPKGTLIARGQVIRMGRSILFLEATLEAPDGTLLAKSSATAKPLPVAKVAKAAD